MLQQFRDLVFLSAVYELRESIEKNVVNCNSNIVVVSNIIHGFTDHYYFYFYRPLNTSIIL